MINLIFLSIWTITCIFTTNSIKIKRVAIIGSGPGGLGLAACLKRLGTDVTEVEVFESRENFLQPALGGGVQITSGARVFENIGAFEDLERVAEKVNGIVSRNVGNFELLRLDINKVKSDKKLSFMKSSGAMENNGEKFGFSIMRDALQSLLFEITKKKSKNDNFPVVNIYNNKKCSFIKEEKNETVSLVFSDGTKFSNYDLLVGCDGINSITRNHIESKNFLKISKKYTGIRIAYGVTKNDKNFSFRVPENFSPEKTEKSYRGKLHQYFGNGVYSLCASYGGLNGIQHMLAVVYRDSNPEIIKSFTKKPEVDKLRVEDSENADWVSTDIKNFIEEKLIKAGFPSPKTENKLKSETENEKFSVEPLRLLERCDPDRFIDLPVYDRFLPLKKWSSDSGRVILLGDSAHAMAPFLGQGANQALQDGYTLAKLIKNYNTNQNKNVKSIGKDYEKSRKLATFSLSAKSSFLGWLETSEGSLGGVFRDTLFFCLGFLGIAEKVYFDGATPKMVD